MSGKTVHRTITSPVGALELVAIDSRLAGLYFADHKAPRRWEASEESVPTEVESLDVLERTERQLDEYFRGERREFEIELELVGTTFQRDVWQMLRQIPLGETKSYGKVASEMGLPNHSRAVASANRMNPISIIVPCHRVVGSNHALTGYAGGLDRKAFLLEHEQNFFNLFSANRKDIETARFGAPGVPK